MTFIALCALMFVLGVVGYVSVERARGLLPAAPTEPPPQYDMTNNWGEPPSAALDAAILRAELRALQLEERHRRLQQRRAQIDSETQAVLVGGAVAITLAGVAVISARRRRGREKIDNP